MEKVCHYCKEKKSEVVEKCMHISCKECSQDIIQFGKCPNCPIDYQEHPVDVERVPILEKISKNVDKNPNNEKIIKEFEEKVQPVIDELKLRLDGKVKDLEESKNKAEKTLRDSVGKHPYPNDFQNLKKTVELQKDELITLLNYYQNSLQVLEDSCLGKSDEFYLVRVLQSRLNNLESFLNGFKVFSSEEILSFPASVVKSFLFSDPTSLNENTQYLILFDNNGRKSARGNTVIHDKKTLEQIQPGIYKFYDDLIGYDSFKCNKGLTINGIEKTQLILRLSHPYLNTNYAFAPDFRSICHIHEERKFYWTDRFYQNKEEIIFPGDKSYLRTPLFATHKYIYSIRWKRITLEIHNTQFPYELISSIGINANYTDVRLTGPTSVVLSSSANTPDEFFGRITYTKNKENYFELTISEEGDEINFDAKRVEPPNATFDFYGIKLDTKTARKYAPGVFQWPDGRFFIHGKEFVLNEETVK